MKRIFPFYTWVRKNVEFQLRNFMANSKKYIRLLNIWDGWKNSFITDPDQETDFLKNAMYLPVWKTNKELTYIKFSLPFLDLDDLFTGKMFLSNLTPLIKEPLQYVLGYNMFSGKRLDTNGVNIPLVGNISKFPEYTWDILTGKDLTPREKASLGIVGQRWTNTLKSIVNLTTFGTVDFNMFKQFPTIFTTSNYQDVYINNLRNELNAINNYIYNARNFGIFIPNSMTDLYTNYVGTLKKWKTNSLGYKKRKYW